jgi:hypothetical protein
MKFLAETGSQPFPYFVLLFPFFFVGVWCLVCFLLSQIGGWARLGEKFSATAAPDGKFLYGQSAQFSGFCNYNRCLTIAIAENGLYLKVWSIFRLGHPPLLIPWDQIQNTKQTSLLWFKKVSFDIGSPRIARMSVSKKLFENFPIPPEI